MKGFAHWLALTGPALLLNACLMGPSTRVNTEVPSVVARESNTTPATRTFLDSLRQARAADLPDSASRITSLRASQTLDIASSLTNGVAWAEVLRDSTLHALIQSAVANNRNLRVAQARINEYRALQGIAGSRLFPQISVGTSIGANKIALAASAPIEFEAARATADLAWELDFWGRTRRGRQAAGFDLAGREDDVRATALSLVSDVASAYLQLREADAIITIAEQTLASRAATLQLARRRFEQGLISELDVRQFEATVADPAARVADYARQRTEGENALSLLLGTPPQSIPRGQLLSDIVKAVVLPDSIPGALLARRPDVLRAQHDFQAATARIGVTQAARFPTISIAGQYGAQRPDYGALFDGNGEVYALQAGISLPLFTGGRLSNETKAARARAEQTKNVYEQTVLVALRETSDAATGVRLRRDQLAAQETQERALQAAFSIAERRYASGISSYLEVLDAQRSLFAAQLSRVQVERQYLLSTVQLFRALGGSWDVTR
ncbi:MAG: efflux transporter outer membrane subunit [Phycisphaerae bacterium]|nr:efflux transporter outer membrane subunit [Gemmatimonadaceae bacterium]